MNKTEEIDGGSLIFRLYYPKFAKEGGNTDPTMTEVKLKI